MKKKKTKKTHPLYPNPEILELSEKSFEHLLDILEAEPKDVSKLRELITNMKYDKDCSHPFEKVKALLSNIELD